MRHNEFIRTLVIKHPRIIMPTTLIGWFSPPLRIAIADLVSDLDIITRGVKFLITNITYRDHQLHVYYVCSNPHISEQVDQLIIDRQSRFNSTASPLKPVN